MASPDVTGYLGLELVDVDEQDLLATALTSAVDRFPDWEPREGNTEVVLLELLAGITAEQVYTLNQLPAGITEVLLRLFGATRNQGTAPGASVRFTTSLVAGVTIPAGTTVRIDLGDNVDPYDLVTTAALTIGPGAFTGTVDAVGTLSSTIPNGALIGTPLQLLDAVSGVDDVQLASPLAGGTDPEDGPAFLDRAIPLLSRLTTTLVRPADVEAYVAEQGIARVKVLDLFDPASGGAPGTAPGYVAVAVATTGGATLTIEAKNALAADLRTRMHAGLKVTVLDANVTTVNVTLTVLRYATATDAEVRTAVATALAGYLNPDTWAWTDTVRVNELIAAADGAAGVDTVVSVTTPSANLALSGYAPLARLGVLTVNVVAP